MHFMKKYGYSKTEIEDMIPIEFDIFYFMCVKDFKEEKMPNVR